ncbi:MAG: winged helix-turn-helix transcriptional regulator [Halodesulfurarchaeum sp.]
MPVDEDKRKTLRRFAAVGAASPLAAVSSGDSADSEARKAIRGYISTTPGAHFSKIRDDLHLGTGETQYHLRRLADRGTIETHRDGEYKRFFPAGRFDQFEQVALGYLRRETPRGMVIELLRDPDRSGKELAALLDVSPPTISTTAAELESAGLISRPDGYTLRRPETLVTLILRYADTFDQRAEEFAREAADVINHDR